MIDKPLPRAKEIEDAVIGTLIISETAYDIVDGLITKDYFFDQLNSELFYDIERIKIKVKNATC